MRKIYAIGESLLDIIFRNGQPQTAKAGGSMLNSAVSLGRMGLPVSFISEYGQDDVGNLINNFLNENGVDTRFVHRCNDGNTALALAFLNDKNDARYSFYKNYPERRLDISFPVINKNDIVLCGSFYSISTEIRDKFSSFISDSKKRGALVVYDPNFRQSHQNELKKLMPLIIENMEMASLVRGSHEDFKNIFGAGNPEEAWEVVKKYCSCLVYTANADGVYVRISSFSGKYAVRNIKPVSTIGAGDNFNAGMITSFYHEKIASHNLVDLTEKEWKKVISTAVDFATNVCMSYENYIDLAFASKYLSASRFQI